jgi:hypothetical protein
MACDSHLIGFAIPIPIPPRRTCCVRAIAAGFGASDQLSSLFGALVILSAGIELRLPPGSLRSLRSPLLLLRL